MSNPVVQLQPAYILHTRPYRDTSLLIEALTSEHGRVSLVARGVRSARSKQRGLLQLFSPLLISWIGKGDLHTLTGVEQNGAGLPLAGERLFSAMYVNELLMRLLHRYDPCPLIFKSYEKFLPELLITTQEQPCLRYFEKELLTDLGYAFSFAEIKSSEYYLFDQAHGFIKAHENNNYVFSGEHLLAFAENRLTTREELLSAKRLIRLAFAPLLGSKPLKSRELFVRREALSNDIK